MASHNITANVLAAGGIETEEAEGRLAGLSAGLGTAGATRGKKIAFWLSRWPVKMRAMSPGSV